MVKKKKITHQRYKYLTPSERAKRIKNSRKLKQGRRSAFAKKVPTCQGTKNLTVNFRSGFEREFWKENVDKVTGLMYEPYHIEFTTLETRRYLPDFVEDNPFTGVTTVYETKGYFKGTDRSKLLKVRAAHPRLRIVLVFQRDNFIKKGSKTKYSAWCEKNLFDYCIGVDLRNIVPASNPNLLADLRKKGKIS